VVEHLLEEGHDRRILDDHDTRRRSGAGRLSGTWRVSARTSSVIGLMYRHRKLFTVTLLQDMRQRYAGTTAGLLWVVVYPSALIVLYIVVYLYVFRVQPPGVEAPVYVLRIVSGLVIVIGFSEALNAGTGSLVANRNLLLNAVFPSELIPLRAVLTAQATPAVGLTLCVGLSIALGVGSWLLLLVPLFWLLAVVFVTGLAWTLSLANLVARDVQQALGLVSMGLLIASPIAYTPDMAPGALKILVYLNPLSYFVLPLQDLCVGPRLPPAGIVATSAVLAAVSSSTGFMVFRRAKRFVLDNV
jgi:homopolymeric O-antigen transport system permease protein